MWWMILGGVLFAVLLAISVTRRGDPRYFAGALLALLAGVVLSGELGHVKPTEAAAQPARAQVNAVCPVGVMRDRMVVARMHQLHVPKRKALHAARTLVMRCPGSAVMWFELARVRLAYGLPKQSGVALAMAYRLDPSGSFGPKSEIIRIQRQAFLSKIEGWYFLAFLAVMFVAALALWALNVKYGRKRVRAVLLGQDLRRGPVGHPKEGGDENDG